MLKKIAPLLLLFLVAACVEDVDFEQAENISISPIVESSLIFFDFPASEFSEPTGTAIVVVGDELELDVFNDEFLRDNLIKAEFFFEVTNSIDRNFRADIIMYDANDQITYAFAVNIMPDGNNEVVTTHTEVFEDDLLEQLKNTVRMELVLSMFPSPSGIPLDENSIGNIKMRSKATLFFQIDNE
ncbi:hypothetical protein U8527_18545 [Kordia algicida OT-1]|uniref:Uncharacterized protein n=1 Tax=Kordia algicida OT-1 TaxID=391587 RepID=A9DIZ3_9FLAO|nr:hypothetical protein [Kordia algicida]EDP97994.1 hypothetical protein KAOT1_12292 [Kordia algicida OT-1]